MSHQVPWAALLWDEGNLWYILDQKTKGLKLWFFRDSPLPESVRIYPPSKRSHIPPHKRKPEKTKTTSTQWGANSKSKWCSFCGGVFKRFGFGLFVSVQTFVQRSRTDFGLEVAWFKVSLSGARIWIHTTLPQEFGENGSFLVTMSYFEWENTVIRWRSF